MHRMHPDDPEREKLREEVIADYMSYARYLAGRYSLRGEAAKDLIQAAYLGLVKAVDNFDARYETTFLTYATPMITGEIKRHFRDTTWDVHVPRRMQELSAGMRPASEALAQELGRSPTVEELAAHLHTDPEEIVEAMDATKAYNTASLDMPVTLVGGEGAALGDLLGGEDPQFDLIVDREALKPLLATLTDREKKILLMRFFRNMTQSEIGKELGVSQMQVSRLLTQIIGNLREQLGVPNH
jgi:RNA polymerase sigma-B factor